MKRMGKLLPPDSARLFSDSDPSAPPAGVHLANIDGASRGNPGPASYAVVIRDPGGKVILELAKKLGRETNNVAEYYALLTALDYATTHGIVALRIRSDSELLVRQMQGRYKVKSPDLKPLYERSSKLARQLHYFAIEHVRREMNRDADALANLALDSGDFTTAAQKAVNPDRAREKQSDASDMKQSSASEPSQPTPKPRRIHARFVQGAFVPAEPVDLAEGVEVIIEIRTKI
jgi:ribonuclease HI